MKLLFLSPWFPYPPDNGSRIRVYNLLRSLARKYEVTLAAFSPEEPNLSGLGFCSRVEVVRRTPFRKSPWMEKTHLLMPFPIVLYPDEEMQRRAKTLLATEQYAVAVAFTTTVAAYLFGSGVPKVLDLDTGLTGFALERLRLENTGLRGLRAWLSLQKSILAEREIVRRFDGTVVISRNGRESLAPVLKTARRLAIAGHGVDLDYYALGLAEPEPDTLVYNGSLTFFANHDAIHWFLEHIFPLIRREAPSVTLRVTGKTEGVNLEALPNRDGLQLTGYVPDVRPVVAGASVCVVPIRIGGGQRLKILEAMALGTPVVSTSKGMEGLDDFTPGEHALVADEPEAFAQAVLCLLRNREQRDTIARNARRLMETRYRWDRVLVPFLDLVDQVAGVP